MFKKAIQNPNQTLKTLKYRALKSFKYSGFRRFIVLSRSRTGSNLLISFLNSHPNISAEGEIFSELNGRNYKDVLATAFAAQSYQTRAKGFKIFYYHPQDDESGDLWVDLVNMENLYVIHLKRRNILRVLVSRKIAESQDLWEVTDSTVRDSHSEKCIRMTVEELASGFQQTNAWEKAGDDMFGERPLMTVYYEELVDRPETSYRKIADFLGVRFMPPQTSLKKQNPEKLCDLLTNYEELKNAFTGTEWQSFFEE